MSSKPRIRQHLFFTGLCVVSGIAYWDSLCSLASLAYHSEYYSHTVFIPLLAAYLVYRGRKGTFSGSAMGSRTGGTLLVAGGVFLILQRFGLSWVNQGVRLSVAILGVAVSLMGSFALCYGERAFRKALFPLLLLLLSIPVPMSAMDKFVHVTRMGSAEVASLIFYAFGVPVFRDGYLFVLPGVSIEIAKQCSGIHSTIALFVLTLVIGYLFLRSRWKRGLLLLFVFPIVSLTNGLRIATLTLLAEYVDRNIFISPLHRRGGALFFLIALGLIVLVLRLFSGSRKIEEHDARCIQGEVGESTRNVDIPLT